MKNPPMTPETYRKRMKAILDAHALHGGSIVQVFPDAGLPRFILLKTENGLIAELGPELQARLFNLAWKIPHELHGLVLGVAQLASLRHKIDGSTPAELLRSLDSTELTMEEKTYFVAVVSCIIQNLQENLGVRLHRMMSLPLGEERDAAADQIKKDLGIATDALNKQSMANLHGSKVRCERYDKPVSMPYAAIEEARFFVLRANREPSKGELRAILEKRHKDALPKKTADSFWTYVWKEAGLDELTKKADW
jgi:hypothetical protein